VTGGLRRRPTAAYASPVNPTTALRTPLTTILIHSRDQKKPPFCYTVLAGQSIVAFFDSRGIDAGCPGVFEAAELLLACRTKEGVFMLEKTRGAVHFPTSGHFRGGIRGNAVPIVKVFKNALWMTL